MALSDRLVHGIPGADLGLPSSLPVDVEAVGVGCALSNFTFGQIIGPVAFPEGTYEIKVHLAASTPCSGPVAIDAPGVQFTAGENPPGYFLTAPIITAEIDAAALLHRQIVIKSVVLHGAVINVISDPDGLWNFENAAALKGSAPPDREPPPFSLWV